MRTASDQSTHKFRIIRAHPTRAPKAQNHNRATTSFQKYDLLAANEGWIYLERQQHYDQIQSYSSKCSESDAGWSRELRCDAKCQDRNSTTRNHPDGQFYTFLRFAHRPHEHAEGDERQASRYDELHVIRSVLQQRV